MKKANKEIRKALLVADMRLWELADILGVSEPTIIRWMRHEMPDEMKRDILKKIQAYGGKNDE